MEKQFKKQLDSLSRIFDFLSKFFADHEIDESSAFTINFLVEELFTNMVKHNPGAGKDVHIGIERDGRRVVITLTDFDADPFDITQAKEVDIHQPMESRKEGGLGLHFVRKLADEISYAYQDRTSKITLVKILEN